MSNKSKGKQNHWNSYWMKKWWSEPENKTKGIEIGRRLYKEGKFNHLWQLSGKLHPRIGMKHTEMAKDKMSEAHMGRMFTKEHRQNLSEAMKRRWFRGDFKDYNWKAIRNLGGVHKYRKNDKEILELRKTHTLQEIGDKFDITRERVRQILLKYPPIIREKPIVKVKTNELRKMLNRLRSANDLLKKQENKTITIQDTFERGNQVLIDADGNHMWLGIGGNWLEIKDWRVWNALKEIYRFRDWQVPKR